MHRPLRYEPLPLGDSDGAGGQHRACHYTPSLCAISERTEPCQTSAFWTVVGFLGQALFTARFLVQWISSERERYSSRSRGVLVA